MTLQPTSSTGSNRRVSQRLPSPYRPEAVVVANSLAQLERALDWASASPMAVPWVQAVRQSPPPFWAMESLLKEFPISTSEGLALMRLAEALLRVPDAQTAILLTADQLGTAQFDSAGDAQSANASTFAKLSAQAIALSKKFLPAAAHGESGDNNGLLGKLGAKTVVSATLRAVQLLGKQFVLGQTIEEAQHQATKARNKTPRLTYSYDMLGEGARTDADALRYLDSYKYAISAIATQKTPSTNPQQSDGISIKLSALHPRYEALQAPRVMDELLGRVWQLCDLAAAANINLTIDAEEVDRLEISLDVLDALLARIAAQHPNWTGFGLALQAYQTRALALIDVVAQLARAHKVQLMCRLVKGAYWDAEIKRTQELGLPHYPVFTHKNHTDINYLACAKALLDAQDVIYPQFATHNAGTIAALLHMAKGKRFELQRLHGMGEGVYREVLATTDAPCRVYAPVGAHKDLLAYLVRRLLENGANSSFVNQLGDTAVPLDVLLASPLVAQTRTAIALPTDLFVTHRNSAGLDITQRQTQDALHTAWLQCTVPSVPVHNEAGVTAAMQRAKQAWPAWRDQTADTRASILESAADKLQNDMAAWCALLVKEAYKTWPDAVAEVREAIDFMRYYAHQARGIMATQTLPGPTGERNTLQLKGRGVWVCISPWNFPLAIFLGQVSAALVTGNAVLAKPAEQTPAIAQAAVNLLCAHGVPTDVLQLLNGTGETVGAALVAQPDVAGVVFTGSTQVAKIIQRALAAKDGAIVPLIAETGGLNAMVVDSSALPEQVADAVVQSSFKSAGQRCSALRLLCVHEGVADHVIEMIQGAANELCVGPTADFAVDVGAVIDADAQHSIQQRINGLHTSAKPLPLDCKTSQEPLDAALHIVNPKAFEVAAIADVGAEIFGPVLQIVRWSGDPRGVIDQINALGYGLTLGIQTRIDSRAQQLAHAAHVGNVYVNRNMIGAVVGVQPFGGEGLSGTGPKAGGPNYLPRFCVEQTLTINTTAAGGNATLLAGLG